MRFFQRIFLLVFFFHSLVNASEKLESLNELEIRSYTPEKLGLKDLVFEARIENLTEMLKRTGNLGELTDVYFKIYWMPPSEFRINVYGLPSGFEEIKNDLKILIKGKLNFIFPEKLTDTLKGYTLKEEIQKGKKIIKAQDLTYTKPISEYDIEIDSVSGLKKISSNIGENQSMETNFKYSTKTWSNNKFVLDSVEMKSKGQGGSMNVAHTLEYTSVAGIGFPKKIVVKNIANIKIMEPVKGKDGNFDPKKLNEKMTKSESGSTLTFSNYEVNTNKAIKYITENVNR